MRSEISLHQPEAWVSLCFRSAQGPSEVRSHNLFPSHPELMAVSSRPGEKSLNPSFLDGSCDLSGPPRITAPFLNFDYLGTLIIPIKSLHFGRILWVRGKVNVLPTVKRKRLCNSVNGQEPF